MKEKLLLHILNTLLMIKHIVNLSKKQLMSSFIRNTLVILLSCIFIAAFICGCRYLIKSYNLHMISQAKNIPMCTHHYETNTILSGKIIITPEMWRFFQGVPVLNVRFEKEIAPSPEITIRLKNSSGLHELNMKIDSSGRGRDSKAPDQIHEYIIRACKVKPELSFLSYEVGINEIELILPYLEDSKQKIIGKIVLDALGQRMIVAITLFKAFLFFCFSLAALIAIVRIRYGSRQKFYKE